jgi:hypothetical protein
MSRSVCFNILTQITIRQVKSLYWVHEASPGTFKDGSTVLMITTQQATL